MDEMWMPWLRGRGSIPEDHEYLKLRRVVLDQEAEVALLRRRIAQPWTKALTKKDAERELLKKETLRVTGAYQEVSAARQIGPKKRRKEAERALLRAKAELSKAYDKLQSGKGKEKVDELLARTATQARADEISRGALLAKLDAVEAELRVNSYSRGIETGKGLAIAALYVAVVEMELGAAGFELVMRVEERLPRAS
jgi:hypothetical protein